MPNRLLILVLALIVAAMALACDDNGTDDETTATPTATVEEQPATPTMPVATMPPAATPTPAPAGASIRDVDLTSQPDVQSFVTSFGGDPAPERIIYADLTGDGREDAVLPVSSGGTLGDLVVFVYGYVGNDLQLLVRVLPAQPRSGVSARVEGGKLKTREAHFADNDPLCCPSEIRRVTYRWNGSMLVIENESIETAQ